MGACPSNMTEIERRILAVLEEAGEEDIAALINSVGKWRGNPAEIGEVQNALASLISMGFLLLAASRVEPSLQWDARSIDESLAAVARVDASFRWDQEGNFWRWRDEFPRIQILLSDRGKAMSRKILQQYGWRLTEPQ